MNTEARVSRGNVGQPQLHPLDAVPAIEAQGADGMHRLAAVLSERYSEFLPG